MAQETNNPVNKKPKTGLKPKPKPAKKQANTGNKQVKLGFDEVLSEFSRTISPEILKDP